MEWLEEALCKQIPTEVFFDHWYDLERSEKQEIVEMCERCPVMQKCYDYAVKSRSHGVWAGKDFRDGKPFSPYVSKRKITAEMQQKQPA